MAKCRVARCLAGNRVKGGKNAHLCLPTAPTALLVLVATLALLVLLACAPALAVVVVVTAVSSAVVTAALALVMTLHPLHYRKTPRHSESAGVHI
jgi:hypothetical protein